MAKSKGVIKEKALPSRRRKRASKGHVIRVSDLVYDYVNKRRFNRRRLSHDAYMRLVLGLPDRATEEQWIKDGRPSLIVEGWIDGYMQPGARGCRFFLHEKDANGAMIRDYAEKRIAKIYKPIKMRELR